MESNKKENHESTNTSLQENVKWCHLKTSKVNIQNRFYNEPSKYIPEDGEIIEVFKILKNLDNNGLECNHSNPTTAIQSKLDHLQSKSALLALHRSLKNSKNFSKMRPKNADIKNIMILIGRSLIAQHHLKQNYLTFVD